MIHELAWMVPLAPLVAAGLIAGRILGGARGDDAEAPTARLAAGAAWLSLALLLVLDLAALRAGAPGELTFGTWFASGDIALRVSFLLDGLGLGFATLAAAIGVVTLRFSRAYLHREAGFHRFHMAMCLFLAGMLTIVLAGNAALAFAGWELAGVSSYLLIGYAWDRPTASGNALFAFVANRIGDAGFVLGLALAFLWLGGTEWTQLSAQGSLDKVTARLLLFGFLLAAVAKSAQIPFAPWIARALEGPTPSSAIFYGSLMVHAGVFLVLRLEPVLRLVPDVMVYLALIGAATALHGWLAGLVQSDVKSALVFATTTQVGLMFLACGLGWFELAAWHMGLHAAWRAWQFLLAPSYMHLVEGAAPPAPAWLARRQGLFGAALARFWLDPLAQAALLRPLKKIGEDARMLDERVLAPMIGMPETARAASVEDEVIRGRGLAGRLLAWLAGRLQRFETHLVMRGGGGPMLELLKRTGGYFRAAEELLEQPRYLLLLVIATFIVIL